MRIHLKSDTLWVNTMPRVLSPGESEETSYQGLELTTEHEGILSEGRYELEVRIKGPDGKEHSAVAQFVVAHAC